MIKYSKTITNYYKSYSSNHTVPKLFTFNELNISFTNLQFIEQITEKNALAHVAVPFKDVRRVVKNARRYKHK